MLDGHAVSLPAERVGSLKETVNSPASPFHELGLQAHATMLGFALC